MIQVDAFILRHARTGAFFRYWSTSIWTTNPLNAYAMTRSSCERVAEKPYAFHRDLEDAALEVILAPMCGCCGKRPRGFNGHPDLHQVGDETWRCARHVGRNPCAIEGCGKTRASRHPASDSFLCGAHWRLAPHRLKMVYRRLWRLAKRNQRKHLGDAAGWTKTLNERYWRNWYRLIRETRLIVHPPAMVAEILPSGPAPAALVAELERLGL